MAPPTRTELRRADYARRGVIAILAAVLVLLLLGARSTGIIGGPDTISAQLANAGGSLVTGADVKMRGVIIGRVDSIAPGPHGGVRVRLDMKDGRLAHVPANVVARILPATVFGNSFVDLTTHGPSASRTLRAGAVVPADRSQQTLELQQALDDIDRLVKAVHPAQLSATLGAAARALDGHGRQLGRMIDGLDDYLAKVEPRLPLLTSDLGKLADNLALLSRVAPDLLDATSDSLSTLRTLATQASALTRLLTGGTELSDSARRFLARNRADLVSFLHSAAQVGDIYHDYRHRAFTDSFATIRAVMRKAGTIIEHGWNNNHVALQTGTPGHYTANDCPRFGSARGDNCPGAGRSAGEATSSGGRR